MLRVLCRVIVLRLLAILSRPLNDVSVGNVFISKSCRTAVAAVDAGLLLYLHGLGPSIQMDPGS
jgi:hypothetical protein